MILKIAWRNIWRSRLRSFIVIGAIIMGIWAVSFFIAFSNGFIEGFVSSTIENELSHIQIHHPGFKAEKEVEYYIGDAQEVEMAIAKETAVNRTAKRSLFNAMITTARGARGVQLRGIEPEKEAALTKIDQKIIQGKYFGESKARNPILVSERLAEKLKLKVKSKPVIQFQLPNGERQQVAFKVIGIFKSENANFDERNVMVQQSDVYRLADSIAIVHEVAMLLDDADKLLVIQANLKKALPDSTKYLVETYREVSPQVSFYESQMGVSNWVMIIIIMLALIFGIINTMLMAVLERTREFGMLLAVGMKRGQVFNMILTETVLLSAVAAPIGLFLGYLTISYLGVAGIDLAAYQQGMDKFGGLSSKIYPSLALANYIQITISIATTAVLAALYPARKATKLIPVEAIRSL